MELALAKDQSLLEERIVEGLTPAQRDAVLSPERYVRVVAGAGAGKTETLGRRVVLLLGRGAEPRNIVAFTFNERAAAELKERIYRRVEDLLGREKCARLSEMFVGTIHAFCARVLQDHFGYGNHDILDEDQEMAFLLQRGWELGFGHTMKDASLYYAEYCSVFKHSEAVVSDELLDLDSVRASPDSRFDGFADQVEGYWDLLDQNRILTFDRMVRLAAERVRACPGLVACHHLIVDEYQDINRAQEALIWAMASSPALASCMVVGDPRQCIYEWRGSDPGCFNRFADSRPAARISLTTNRRSTRAIIFTANTLAAHFQDRALREPMEPHRETEGVVLSVVWTNPEEEARWVAGQIRRLVDEAHIGYSDVAILLRSVKTSGDPIISALEAEGIPYTVGGRLGLFRRPETRAMAALWLWFANLDWQVDGEWLSGDELLELAGDRWPLPFDRHDVARFREDLRAGEFRNLTEAYQELLLLLGYSDLDPSSHVGQVRLASLGRFNKLLVDYEAATLRRRGRRTRWPTFLKNLGWYIIGYAGGGYSEQMPDDHLVEGATFVATVHQAKGLEWPLVFVPALVDRRFPSSMHGRPKTWMLGRTLFDAERYEGCVDAERRLFYVAMTRARDALVFSRFSRTARQDASPSRFLVEADALDLAAGEEEIGPALESRARPEDQLLTKSVGEVITYLRCPHQYRMRYVWGYEPELSRELGFGKSLHSVLRTLAERQQAGDDPLSVLPDVLDQEFFLPYRSQEAEAQIAERVRPGLKSFVQAHADLLARTHHLEARLECQVGQRATITGRADVLVCADEGLEIVEYKSAQDAMDADEAMLQVQLYAAALTDLGHRCVAGRLIHVLDEGHPVVEVPVAPHDLETARRKAESALRGMVEGCFEARPAAACQRCDFSRLCRAAGAAPTSAPRAAQ